MTFDAFFRAFSAPQPNTAANLQLSLLNKSPALQEFVHEVGGGVFAEGFISIASQREQVDHLGGWEHWIPSGVQVFGCSAFGFLMCTSGEDLWLVDTQYGQVVESDFSIVDFINELSLQDTQEEILRSSLFKLWNGLAGPLPPTSVLSPTPAIPLGGTWTASSLAPMTLSVYLSFTGQMFLPDGGMPAEVRRLDDE